MRRPTILFIGVSLLLLPAAAAAEPARELNRIVYWGNLNTGASVRVVNEPDAEKKAEALVKQRGGTGWVLLENSTKPGFGAAICRKEGDLIQFYVAHGFASAKEAVTAAKAKANGGGTFCSNPGWRVAELPEPQESTVVGTIKGWLSNFLLTHKKSGAQYYHDCVKPNGSLDATAATWKPAAWCPKPTPRSNSGLRG